MGDRAGALRVKLERAVYAAAGGVVAAIWAPWGVVQHARGRTQGDARMGWRRLPHLSATPPLWIHAASVGEVNAAAPVVREWLRVAPGTSLLWTTQTMTGRARVLQEFPQAVAHLAPFDAWGAPARVLRAAQPAALLIAETEIWPGWLMAAHRAQVPVAFINARMSARSAAQYHRIRGLVTSALARVHLVAAQSAEDADRFVAAGAPPHSVVVTGNTKWDQNVPRSGQDEPTLTGWLRRTGRPLGVAGSTHPAEEEIVADAARSVRATGEQMLLVIAPRHVERVADAEAAVRRAWPDAQVARWSTAQHSAAHPALDVVLLDTHGELAAAYAAATVAFVGGTLAPHGGHNVAEPALWGVPVAFGPSTEHCGEMAKVLLHAHGAVRVADATTLARAWLAWLTAAAAQDRAGGAAASAVTVMRGAAGRTLVELQRRGIAPSSSDA